METNLIPNQGYGNSFSALVDELADQFPRQADLPVDSEANISKNSQNAHGDAVNNPHAFEKQLAEYKNKHNYYHTTTTPTTNSSTKIRNQDTNIVESCPSQHID